MFGWSRPARPTSASILVLSSPSGSGVNVLNKGEIKIGASTMPTIITGVSAIVLHSHQRFGLRLISRNGIQITSAMMITCTISPNPWSCRNLPMVWFDWS